MSYAIKTITHNLEIAEVTSIVVTDVFFDQEQSDYWREIRVFAIEGYEGDTTEKQVATLRIRAPTSDALHLDVPPSQF